MPLPVSMIEPSFRTSLMTLIGSPPLLDPGLLAAFAAAISMAPIAMRADEEDGVTAGKQADSLEENRFVCRHARAGGLDNGPCFVSA
ncbi:MAG: hypothetical protein FJW38_22215 [Acidobacteria bacterium]|nr:hypothetical protein [Acidobacteriota bacterium]